MSRPLRILWVGQWFPPDLGALPGRITETSAVWTKAGHEVSVLTALPHHPLGVVPEPYRRKLVVREKFGDIDVVRCWLLALPNRRMWQRTLCQISFSFTSVLLGLWFIRRRPDVVIVSSPPFFVLPGGWLVSRILRAAFVFEVRDLYPAIFVEAGVMKKGLPYRLLESIEEWFYRAADRIIVVTRSFRERLVSRGVPAEKIGVIPNGADIEAWSPEKAVPRFRSELGGDGTFLAGFVGTHGVLTGLEVVLEAAGILRDDPRIAIAFVGEGAARERLMAIAEERGLTNVRFHPAVTKEQVTDVYASLDACLVSLQPVEFLSKFIPSKVFEMLASGKPLIAALNGEAAEIVRAAGNAVVAPGDAAALAREIRNLASHPAEAAEAGARGRVWVAAHFNRDDLAREYVRELERAVERGRPPAEGARAPS